VRDLVRVQLDGVAPGLDADIVDEHVGLGQIRDEAAARPSSSALERAYSAPPELHAYSTAPSAWRARMRSTTDVIGMRLLPNERTRVSSMSTNRTSGLDMGPPLLGG
jgi:hypothetical protein